jgi:hypothetical protein
MEEYKLFTKKGTRTTAGAMQKQIFPWAFITSEIRNSKKEKAKRRRKGKTKTPRSRTSRKINGEKKKKGEKIS